MDSGRLSWRVVDGLLFRLRVQRPWSEGAREALDCGVVVVGKGVSPNLAAATRSGLAAHWGIRVGPHLETTDPDVYSAGDCVETIDVVAGGQAGGPARPSSRPQRP